MRNKSVWAGTRFAKGMLIAYKEHEKLVTNMHFDRMFTVLRLNEQRREETVREWISRPFEWRLELLRKAN